MNKQDRKALEEGIEGWQEFCNSLPTNIATTKKQQLIAMAERGESRPHSKTHPLGKALVVYTCKGSGYTYDDDFTQTVKKLAPHWFVDPVAKNKEELLELAKNGKPKPANKTLLSNALGRYVCIKSRFFDAEFKTAIKKLAPSWFEYKLSNPAIKKQQLLKLAASGKPRPVGTLNNALVKFAFESQSNFDPVFAKKIRHLAPHWFKNANSVVENKKQLLDIAKKGERRPQNHLGKRLSNYTLKSCKSYDAAFVKEIKKFAPHWFIDQSDIANEKKKQLIEMAKRGEARPNQRKHHLGYALTNYTRKTSSTYDLVFDKQIRKLAPHWFVDTAAENKKELIKMAKRGERKPTVTKHRLGRIFSNYIFKSSVCYDEKFDKEIRRLAPNWFINTATVKKQQLIEMAKRGELRPKQRKHVLAGYFQNYITKSSTSYDPIFDKQIRKLAPHWFTRNKKAA